MASYDLLKCRQVELVKSSTCSISFASLISNIISTISKQNSNMNNSSIFKAIICVFYFMLAYAEKIKIFFGENQCFCGEGSVVYTEYFLMKDITYKKTIRFKKRIFREYLAKFEIILITRLSLTK